MTIAQVDTNLWRGPRPNSAAALRWSGIDLVVNLESGFYEFSHLEVDQEREFLQTNGIEMVHIKMNAILCPSYDNVASALAAIDSGRKVYVHCKDGVDRTGCVVACYRVHVQGWSPGAAIKEMHSMGFHLRYWYWLPSLLSVMKQLS